MLFGREFLFRKSKTHAILSNMDGKLFDSWKQYVPDLARVLQKMDEKTIIALGVAAFPRIIPSLFLKRYAIYCVKDATDIDLLRNYTTIYSLEEKHPKIAAKVHATNYLLGNFAFRAFLKSRKHPFRLLFYQTTPKILEKLEEMKIEWIGNRPESFSGVLLKGDFRDLVKSLGLPAIPDWRIKREEFLKKSFAELTEKWGRVPVVQRADFDVAGELGTFFVRTEKDWKEMHDILEKDERYAEVTISPFVDGLSMSMLGCVTHKGILTSTLQLQLVDVPEALHGQYPTGVFLGHDWVYRDWPESVEHAAERATRALGEYLASRGFHGIFGIDFVYDSKTQEIFPIECNPRFTGALPVYSLMTAAAGVPTVEFFHLMAHLKIDADFDFAAVDEGLKKRLPLSHISVTPKGIYSMKLPLAAGIYSFDAKEKSLKYERKGAFYWDFQSDKEFMIIDSVPRVGGTVIQNVPRLFKLIFPRGIARSSSEVEPDIGALLITLSDALRRNQEHIESDESVHPAEEELP